MARDKNKIKGLKRIKQKQRSVTENPELVSAVGRFMQMYETNKVDITRYQQEQTLTEQMFFAMVLIPMLWARPLMAIWLIVSYIEDGLINYLVRDRYFGKIILQFGLDTFLSKLMPEFLGEYYPFLGVMRRLIEQFSALTIRWSPLQNEVHKRLSFHLGNMVTTLLLKSFIMSVEQTEGDNLLPNLKNFSTDIGQQLALFADPETTSADVCNFFEVPLDICKFHTLKHPHSLSNLMEYHCGTAISTVALEIRAMAILINPSPVRMQLMAAWLKGYGVEVIEVPGTFRNDRPIYVLVNMDKAKELLPNVEVTQEMVRKWVRLNSNPFKYRPKLTALLGKLCGYSEVAIKHYTRVTEVVSAKYAGKNPPSDDKKAIAAAWREAMGNPLINSVPIPCAGVCPTENGDAAWNVMMTGNGGDVHINKKAVEKCRFFEAQRISADPVEPVKTTPTLRY